MQFPDNLTTDRPLGVAIIRWYITAVEDSYNMQKWYQNQLLKEIYWRLIEFLGLFARIDAIRDHQFEFATDSDTETSNSENENE